LDLASLGGFRGLEMGNLGILEILLVYKEKIMIGIFFYVNEYVIG
jgi:hypothetical protein